MTIRTVIYADDARLRQKANKVRDFTPRLEMLAADMIETMRSYDGVGLAGPQIGVMARIFVAEIPLPQAEDQEPHPQSGVSYILVNPEIITTAQQLAEGEEGCLSIPDRVGLVERPEWVEIRAQEVTGKRIKLKVDGLLARIFMHEIDHLNGVLYTDHIAEPQKLWRVEKERESGAPVSV